MSFYAKCYTFNCVSGQFPNRQMGMTVVFLPVNDFISQGKPLTFRQVHNQATIFFIIISDKPDS